MQIDLLNYELAFFVALGGFVGALIGPPDTGLAAFAKDIAD